MKDFKIKEKIFSGLCQNIKVADGVVVQWESVQLCLRGGFTK